MDFVWYIKRPVTFFNVCFNACYYRVEGTVCKQWAGVELEGNMGVIGVHFAKMTPNFGFVAAFGDYSWPSVFELWGIPEQVMIKVFILTPNYFICGCFRGHPRPLILNVYSATPGSTSDCWTHTLESVRFENRDNLKGIVFVLIPAHAPITAHQRHFQFKICGAINRPLKSGHPVASDYVLSPVLNTENHQLTLC